MRIDPIWQVSGVNALANSGKFIAEVRRINGDLTTMDARNAWRSLWHNALTERRTCTRRAISSARLSGRNRSF
jgi:hypothetical protein